MQIDARECPPGTVLSADICIVGGGPAGLALAVELSATPLQVILVESGGLEPDAGADRLSYLEPRSEDFVSPMVGIRRRLGGLAASWNAPHPHGRGVRLLPFDAIDFERRAWVPDSGWPFSLDVLRPYYERARRMLGAEVGSTSDRGANGESYALGEDVVATRDDIVARDQVTDGLVGASLDGARTTVLHHATAVRLQLDDAGSRVVALTTRARVGSDLSIHAAAFVLAGGAIENARLLLASAEPGREVPGNAGGNVGSYYMDHLYLAAGFLWPRESAAFARLGAFDVASLASPTTAGRVRLSAEAQQRHGLPNASARVEPRLAARFAAATAAVRGLRVSARSVERPAPLARGTRVLRSAQSLIELAVKTRGRSPLRPGWSRRPAAVSLIDHFAVVMQVEQAPVRDRRVELTSRLDDLGVPIVALHWGWSEIERESLWQQADILTGALQTAGMGVATRRDSEGSVTGSDAPALLMSSGAQHHMGTTRMHLDVTHGVVDSDCRVHGTTNLYACGASVFPTGGSANITLTIVALSIRLADHLRAVSRPVSLG